MPKGNNYKINLWKSISLENFEFVAEKRFNSVQERFFLRGADLGRMQNLHRDRQGPDSILHLENNEFSILLRDMAAGSAASGKERGIKGRGDLTAEELEEYNKTCFNTHLDYQLNVFWDSFEVLKDAIPRYVRMIYFNMDLLEKLVNELNSEGMNPGLGERYGRFFSHNLRISETAVNAAVERSVEVIDMISEETGHTRTYQDILKIFERHMSRGHAYKYITNELEPAFNLVCEEYFNVKKGYGI